jgi:RNA polymerase sigma factor (sigma-70 family)
MDYSKATNNQLLLIVSQDKDCPTHLLSGVAVEMIKRRLWDGVILYSAKRTFKNVIYVLERLLKMDDEELIHIGHIHIMKRLKGFIPGSRTLKTYLIMCLSSFFGSMMRDAQTDKRKSNVKTTQVDSLSEFVQTRIFRSNTNVEKEVINKIMLEEALAQMKPNEQKAIKLELMGYQKNEIKIMMGYHPNGNLITKAHRNLRKYLEA